MAFEKSGIYRDNHKEKNVKKKGDSAIKKCNYPFSIRGVYIIENQWKVQVICGLHYHDLPNSLVGHPYAGILSKKEKKFIAELSISGNLKTFFVDSSNVMKIMPRRRRQFTMIRPK